ncbi:beta-1,3-galactosyltransferase 5-like [Gigantopelta aegis]|uniref:beta-1,3-galactosyltransferase 5-like n=1 Tax=Gigantopelta aegis TaxID=1735272 RepID=UPI001B88AC94|nr:beta-1,3-galactosyltransferase 5-like [Gigantopelta aegis]
MRVSPLDYTILKHSARACGANERPQLVILVMSLHHMTSQRQAIRDTWGSVSTLGTWPGTTEQFSIRLCFVLGLSKNDSLNMAVDKEAEKKGDLILVDIDDTYYNLTRKVLMGFKWIKEFCPIVKHVMKVDEDTYINIPQFIALINSRDWNNLIYGPYFPSARVERVGKSMVSEEAYPIAVYPPHVKGNMYCMSVTVAMEILAVSEYMPYVNMEDAYITGILAKIFDVRHAGLPGKQYDLFSAATPCELATGNKMVSQQIFNQTFYKIWFGLKDPSLCLTKHP